MISLKHHVERLFAGLVLLLLASVAANAQSVTGSISGVVVDSNRGVIAGAKVTLISEQTKAPRDLSSSEDGRFSFAALQPGIYTIKIEHSGFQILLKQKVVLSANESLALGDFLSTTSLTPVTNSVTVTIGGIEAEVEFAGGAPGQIGGVYEIAVRVPEGLERGPQPVVVETVEPPHRPAQRVYIQVR